MLVTEFGIDTAVRRFVANAYSPMLVTALPIVTEVMNPADVERIADALASAL